MLTEKKLGLSNNANSLEFLRSNLIIIEKKPNLEVFYKSSFCY